MRNAELALACGRRVGLVSQLLAGKWLRQERTEAALPLWGRMTRIPIGLERRIFTARRGRKVLTVRGFVAPAPSGNDSENRWHLNCSYGTRIRWDFPSTFAALRSSRTTVRPGWLQKTGIDGEVFSHS